MTAQKVKVYEFDEICESQEFNHDHLFVSYSDHREEVNALAAELERVKAELQSKHEQYVHANTVYKKSRDELTTVKEKLAKAVEIINKFITKSNGLSFYARNEFEAAKLESEDNSQLVNKIQDLYNYQCDAEQTLKEIEWEK